MRDYVQFLSAFRITLGRWRADGRDGTIRGGRLTLWGKGSAWLRMPTWGDSHGWGQ
jgi:hypothetical protein